MKTDRMLAIIMLLLNRKRVSATELAERFEISLRTVYRDLETIGQAGIPIISYPGAGGGYEIMEWFRIDKQIVTLDELTSIVSALKGVQSSLNDPQLESLLNKVGALIARGDIEGERATEDLLIDLNPWRSDMDRKNTVMRIRVSIRENTLVQFAYRNKKQQLQERLVEPMTLMLKGFTWYLYGFCRLRNDFRTFRITRINNLKQLEERFQLRDHSLDELQDQWKQKYENQNDLTWIQIKLRIDHSARIDAEDIFGVDAVTQHEDGTLRVHTKWRDESWLHFWLLGFGSRAVVLEPPELAERVVEEAQRIVDLYG